MLRSTDKMYAIEGVALAPPLAIANANGNLRHELPPPACINQSRSEIRESLRRLNQLAYSDAILISAERLLMQDGGRTPRVEAIAERAGVSVGTLYNYFRSKESLLSALHDRVRGHLRDMLEQPYESACAISRLHELLDRIVALVKNEHGRITLMTRLAESHLPVARAEATRSQQQVGDYLGLNKMLGELVQRGVAEGSLKRDLPVELFVRMLQVVFESELLQTHINPESALLGQRAARILELALDGALAR